MGQGPHRAQVSAQFLHKGLQVLHHLQSILKKTEGNNRLDSVLTSSGDEVNSFILSVSLTVHTAQCNFIPLQRVLAHYCLTQYRLTVNTALQCSSSNCDVHRDKRVTKDN